MFNLNASDMEVIVARVIVTVPVTVPATVAATTIRLKTTTSCRTSTIKKPGIFQTTKPGGKRKIFTAKMIATMHKTARRKT